MPLNIGILTQSYCGMVAADGLWLAVPRNEEASERSLRTNTSSAFFVRTWESDGRCYEMDHTARDDQKVRLKKLRVLEVPCRVPWRWRAGTNSG